MAMFCVDSCHIRGRVVLQRSARCGLGDMRSTSSDLPISTQFYYVRLTNSVQNHEYSIHNSSHFHGFLNNPSGMLDEKPSLY
jgi:hypothetical protein